MAWCVLCSADGLSGSLLNERVQPGGDFMLAVLAHELRDGASLEVEKVELLRQPRPLRV